MGKGSAEIRQQQKTVPAPGDLQPIVPRVGIPVLADGGDAVDIEICSEGSVKLMKIHNKSPGSIYHKKPKNGIVFSIFRIAVLF